MCDESNDRNEEKNLVILVRLYDDESNSVKTRFLDMPMCNIGTAQSVFSKIEQCLEWARIQVLSCRYNYFLSIAFSFPDNALFHGEMLSHLTATIAMLWKAKKISVMTRIKEKQSSVFDLGCICHLANLAVGVGIKQFPLPIEDLLVDVYCHFDRR